MICNDNGDDDKLMVSVDSSNIHMLGYFNGWIFQRSYGKVVLVEVFISLIM